MPSASPTAEASEPRARKRLIVCCDGTWQSSVTIKKNVPSNLTRLARSFAREDVVTDDKSGKETVWEQIVYYDAGIGTGEISKAEKDRQGGFGHGFVANVIEAYNFLVLNWYPGDKIYCFGFSRGAYTARAVAGLVNDIGVISPRDMQDFPELYAAYSSYKGGDSHGFRKSREYRRWQAGVLSKQRKDPATGLALWDQIPHALVTEESRLVEVVGVFDTVGSLGVPDSPYFTVDAIMTGINYWWGGESPGFHNVNLSPYIANAFHAMALDEHRGPFSPTLWHLPPPLPGMSTTNGTNGVKVNGTDPAAAHKAALDAFEKLHFDKPRFDKGQESQEEEYERRVDAAWGNLIDCEMRQLCTRLHPSNLQQVWFPGVHINIGGGSDDVLGDRDGDFEQIALISFAWMCEQVKPFVRFEERLRKRSVRDRMALIVPVLAEISAGGNKDFGSWVKPFWKALDWTGAYKAETKQIAPSTVCGWAEGPIVDSYTLKMRATGSITRTPGEYCKTPKGTEQHQLGDTQESIHPTVAYRMKKLGPEKYDPEALRNFKRVWVKENERWEWQKAGVVVPEFKISEKAKFSRFLAANYVKYLAQVEQLKALERKGSSSAAHAEEPIAQDTQATAFLKATEAGKDWVKP
ncbi:uncharacterized protein B0I36DRAFT_389287 [Microdochium trichocladiopsis]|uniref:T6SS Phospholipase effector Tle1-like catalytic domain-containing protein n=1 Tax=Microdochium trichocladiopsis TaxID=1682393 RepID=A0A9P8XU44_9PEZI|nr:uncharacterized protein B0I36DRAFT_389287 [Microdochium trichocladiopsis]KAH7014374.1 hypothetical protein B0I36DRAFT_389287 [Microdochium trichocladiopsis]